MSSRSFRKRWLALRAHVSPVVAAPLPDASGRVLVDLRDERGLRIATWGGAHGQRLAWKAWTSLLHQRSWDLVLDVGANYGEFAVPAARRFGDRVVAVEPNPRVASLLRDSLRQVNEGTVVACGAVGAEPSMAWLHDADGSGTARTLAVGPAGGGPLLVPVTTLDELVATVRGDRQGAGQVLIKLDVEGAEVGVLEGALRLLRDPGVTVILAEAVHAGLDRLRAALPEFTPYGLCAADDPLVSLDPEPPPGTSVRDVVFARGVDLITRT